MQASVGDRQRNILFGFTEPYAFDRPLQVGFTVFSRKFDYNYAKELELATGVSQEPEFGRAEHTAELQPVVDRLHGQRKLSGEAVLYTSGTNVLLRPFVDSDIQRRVLGSTLKP